jgi:hypothetical protein
MESLNCWYIAMLLALKPSENQSHPDYLYHCERRAEYSDNT